MTTSLASAPDQVEGRLRLDLSSVILAAGALVAYAPLLTAHAGNLARHPEYHFAPFVLVAVVGLLWTRWAQSPAADGLHAGRRRLWMGIAGVVAWLILAAATVLQSPLFAAASANLAIGCLFLYLAGYRRITNLFGIWCLLWLLFPPPFGLDKDLIQFLQRISSRASGDLLDLVGINHLMAGNVVQLPGRELFVDEACSGIVSVMAVISCSLMFAVWKNRSLFHTLLLVVSGVGWAVVMNIGRIFTIAFAADAMSIDLSTGWQHQALGLLGFSLVFGAVASTDAILCFLLDPIEASELWRFEAERNPAILIWNRLVAFANPHLGEQQPVESSDQPISRGLQFGGRSAAGVAGAFALLGFFQLGMLDWKWAGNQPVVQALAVNEAVLPDELGPWQRGSFEEVQRDAASIFGEHSRVFTYQNAESKLRLVAALDFPFSPPWHNLCGCYEGSGWTLLEQSVISLPTVSDGTTEDAWRCVEARFGRRSGESGYLVFCFFDEDGLGVDAPTDSFWQNISVRLRRAPGLGPKPIFQVQAFVESPAPLSEAQEDEVQQALAEIRERFREVVIPGSATSESTARDLAAEVEST